MRGAVRRTLLGLVSGSKTHEGRQVAFPALLLPLLRARCAGTGREAVVTAGADGGVLRNGDWRQRCFDPAVRRLRRLDETFPKVTPHDLLHTAVSPVSASDSERQARG
jgi:hypothetical protein